VTQHGSFPGRPRGRRARPNNDVPEWAGYDAVPQDQREFPDLTPIRGQEARARDGRAQGGAAQGGAARGGARDGYPPNGPGYAQGQGGYAQGQGVSGQPPWQDQPWQASQVPSQPMQASGLPSQAPGQPLAQPRSPQPRQSPRPASDWANSGDPGDPGDSDDPDDPMQAFSERWHRRGAESGEEQHASRRKRRRLLIAGGVAAVVIAVAVYFLTGGNSNSANLGLGNLVTSFLPGELQQVPNACTSVPNATLSQYLPGQLKMAAPPLNTGAQSSCTWTLDKSPLYRVLEVNLQAYSPSGLASGNGSATFAAEDAYAEDEATEQKPGPRSAQPPATVTDLSGMPGGNGTSAFQATQVFHESGAITDVATVVVRYRNVIVTVVVNGLDHSNKGNYGPESPSVLSSAAQTAARQITGELVH
jgi:hypothetical protein